MACETVAKIIIGVTNILILLVAVIGAIVVFVEYDKIAWSDFDDVKLPAVFLLVLAAVTVISAIVGLCALSDKGKKICRKLYLAIVLLVIAVEVVIIAIAYLYEPTILETIEEKWTETSGRKRLEAAFECCGWTNRTVEKDCGYNATNPKTCKEAITDSVNDWLFAIGVAVIVLVVVEVLLLIAAICLVASKQGADDEGVQPF
jgi:hypothetical protein